MVERFTKAKQTDFVKNIKYFVVAPFTLSTFWHFGGMDFTSLAHNFFRLL